MGSNKTGHARTVEALTRLIGSSIRAIAQTECAAYFRHAGYKA